MNIETVREETCIVEKNWLRPKTPFTEDGKEKFIDSVEFDLNHKGVQKLAENINRETEFIRCYVHFLSDSQQVDGIYLVRLDEEKPTVDEINSGILDENEKRLIVEFARGKL